MTDDHILTLPSARIADANRRAAESILPDDLPAALELASAALQHAADAVAVLRRITKESPELLPYLNTRNDDGATRGVMSAVRLMQSQLAMVKWEAESRIEALTQPPRVPRPTMLPRCEALPTSQSSN